MLALLFSRRYTEETAPSWHKDASPLYVYKSNHRTPLEVRQSIMRNILTIFLATLLPFSWAQSLKPVSPPQGFVSQHNGQFRLDGKPFVSYVVIRVEGFHV